MITGCHITTNRGLYHSNNIEKEAAIRLLVLSSRTVRENLPT